MDLKVIPRGLRLVLEVILEVEERLIGSKKVKSRLIYCYKKLHSDLLEYFNVVEDRVWKYSKELKMSIGG